MNILKRHRVMAATSVVVAGISMILLPSAAAASPVATGLPYGPDTCKQGYVWREAIPSDHVCVTPAVRSRTASENSQVAARRNPTGPYGSNTCIQGYVWREAFNGDVVCVTPEIRTQTKVDNSLAASRVQKAESSPAPAQPRSPAPAQPSKRADIIINRQVTFPGGTPVGGWTKLEMYPNGAYRFSGHMHLSGAPSYTYSGVCAVRSSAGTTFVFQTTGRLHGTFESGSRDHDWNKSGTSQALAAAWPELSSFKSECKNSVNADVLGLVKQALDPLGSAKKVVNL